MGLTQVNTDGVKDDAINAGKIPDDAIGLAHLAAGTDGQVITYDASGNPKAIGPGTDGQVLTSAGAGAEPAFEDAVSEGTQVKSTGESGGTKFLREDGDGTCSWQAVPAGGVDGISSSADANAITIDSSEHVVVGGTTVSGVHSNNQDFVVGNTSNSITGMALNCATGGYTSIVMTDGDGDKNKGLIGYNHADDTFKICNDPASGSDGLVLQSNNDVKVATGNLVIGTAGKGIDFSATADTSASNASMSNELLDDYEEGSWEPAAYSGCTSVGHFGSHYVKIGNVCSIWAYIHQVAGATSSEVFKIDGLPFTAHGQDSYPGSCITHGVDNTAGGAMYVNPIVEGNSDRFKLMGSGDENAWYQLNGDHVGNGDTIMIGITYRTT